MIKCITILARRRREKIISFTLDKDRTFIWALEPPAGLGGFWNALQGWGGQKWPPGGLNGYLPPPTPTYETRRRFACRVPNIKSFLFVVKSIHNDMLGILGGIYSKRKDLKNEDRRRAPYPISYLFINPACLRISKSRGWPVTLHSKIPSRQSRREK